MYSPAALPSRQRAAPAKKRRLSAITGISSLSTAASGLPAFSASRRASSLPFSSRISASASNACERIAGVLCDHSANAARAARTARSTSCGLEFGACASSSPVAGLRIASLGASERAGSPSMKFCRVVSTVATATSHPDAAVGYGIDGSSYKARSKASREVPQFSCTSLHPQQRRAQRLRHGRMGDLPFVHV